MMLLEKDGILIWTGATADGAGPIRATSELPVDLLDQQSDLLRNLGYAAYPSGELHRCLGY